VTSQQFVLNVFWPAKAEEELASKIKIKIFMSAPFDLRMGDGEKNK
jgi:hypothetical protein